MVSHGRQWGLAAKTALAIIVVAGFSVSAGTRAFGGQLGTRPCAEDVAKFCKDVQPRGGGIAQCLKEHEDQLSASCKDRVANMKERRLEFRQACQDDVAKFCKDTKPGNGRIVKCLKEHEQELSAPCQSIMTRDNSQR